LCITVRQSGFQGVEQDGSGEHTGDAAEAVSGEHGEQGDQRMDSKRAAHDPRFGKLPHDRHHAEEDRAERMEKMMRSIRGTAILGCQNWVIHPIMPYGTHDREEGDVEFQIQQTWELNVVFMRKLLECAKENNVIISIENMPMTRFSRGSVSDIMRLVREIDDDNFRVCLDTGHVNVFAGHSLYDAVMEIGDKLQTLHIHDNSGYGDEHKLPWLGTADWAGFGRALREIGFDGVFSYEANVPKGLPKELYPDVRRIMRQCADFILRG